jgi:hypothetical protein
MLSLAAALLLILPAASVDDWVPYEDGRPGGCYRTASGLIYNCSRPPRAEVEAAKKAAAEAAAAPAADPVAELREVRKELEALKRRQAADDAVRAHAEAERLAAEDVVTAAARRDEEAAMAAYNAIEAAMDSKRLRELDARTQACRPSLEKRGYRIVGPGACHAPDGSYVNCPDC